MTSSSYTGSSLPGTGGRGSRQDLLLSEVLWFVVVMFLSSTSALGDLSGGVMISGLDTLETEDCLESELFIIGLIV